MTDEQAIEPVVSNGAIDVNVVNTENVQLNVGDNVGILDANNTQITSAKDITLTSGNTKVVTGTFNGTTWVPNTQTVIGGKTGQDVNLINTDYKKEHINNGAYTQSGPIGSAPGSYNSTTNVLTGISATNLDVYNDSGSNPLSFVLKNGTTVIFTSIPINPGESLVKETFPTFTEIDFIGTTPTFRAITRS